MIKKRYLFTMILLFFMISQVSASDNFTEIDDIAHGNLVYAELTPIPVPDYYPVYGGTQNYFY